MAESSCQACVRPSILFPAQVLMIMGEKTIRKPDVWHSGYSSTLEAEAGESSHQGQLSCIEGPCLKITKGQSGDRIIGNLYYLDRTSVLSFPLTPVWFGFVRQDLHLLTQSSFLGFLELQAGVTRLTFFLFLLTQCLKSIAQAGPNFKVTHLSCWGYRLVPLCTAQPIFPFKSLLLCVCTHT